MIDLSAVKCNDGDQAIAELVECAKIYHPRIITTLPDETQQIIRLLGDDKATGVAGNVGFPSGGQTTPIKAAEARELVKMGCKELDMVISVAKLISGDNDYVEADIRAVIEAADGKAVKVILECHYLNETQIKTACELSIRAGASFVKTGTGWAPTGATLENVAFIKSIVGDAVRIKASGGIRSLETLLEMYQRGATRFGLGLKSSQQILDATANIPGGFFTL